MLHHYLTGGSKSLQFALVSLSLLSTTLAANVVSVASENPFKAMRECARDCFLWNGSGDLIGLFGCRYPYQNECLCRTDLAPAATKHLSTCCDARCTVGPATGDIATAISVYNSYCVANGFEVTAAVAVPAKTTAAGSAPTQSKQGAANAANTATTGQSPVDSKSDPTQAGSSSEPTSTSNGKSGGSGGLSTGAIVGIVAPIVSVFLTALGVLIKVHFGKKKVRQDEELNKKLAAQKLNSA
ncbi:hypothetical protein QBC43DRAFT_353770 [Cladorrhinum sp. PSN259]|nr:hypothetical protein QBC43DRAFT_353770 [Cladorrhinum sp. PSN259]